VCLAAGLTFAARLPSLRAKTRPVYARLGILPEVAEGMQAAAELVPAPRA
jgi:hypothetical protein